MIQGFAIELPRVTLVAPAWRQSSSVNLQRSPPFTTQCRGQSSAQGRVPLSGPMYTTRVYRKRLEVLDERFRFQSSHARPHVPSTAFHPLTLSSSHLTNPVTTTATRKDPSNVPPNTTYSGSVLKRFSSVSLDGKDVRNWINVESR